MRIIAPRKEIALLKQEIIEPTSQNTICKDLAVQLNNEYDEFVKEKENMTKLWKESLSLSLKLNDECNNLKEIQITLEKYIVIKDSIIFNLNRTNKIIGIIALISSLSLICLAFLK